MTLEQSSATAKVNLLLNRATPWLDAESYLPYEGKVVIRNKNAQRIYVRIPTWIDRHGLPSRVDGQAATRAICKITCSSTPYVRVRS